MNEKDNLFSKHNMLFVSKQYVESKGNLIKRCDVDKQIMPVTSNIALRITPVFHDSG